MLLFLTINKIIDSFKKYTCYVSLVIFFLKCKGNNLGFFSNYSWKTFELPPFEIVTEKEEMRFYF